MGHLGGQVRAWGYLAKIAIVLAAIRTGAATASETLVDAAAAAWVVFLLAPMLLALGHARARNRRDYRRARWFAQAIRLLHPFDGWRAEPALVDRPAAGRPAGLARRAGARTWSRAPVRWPASC